MSSSDSGNAPSQSLLIVVSAPSGAGKTTLCRRLLEDFSELKLSISTTTRPPRGQERHGVDYLFTTQQDFEARIASGDFAEWARVHGNYYGTSKSFIRSTLESGDSVLLDIDVQGSESLKNLFGDRCLTVFVAPPSMEALEQRLRGRNTDSEESIQRRLQNARTEMQQAEKFDVRLVNDDLDATYLQLQDVVSRALRGAR